MCYPKPGPRCSSHARKTLETAKTNYLNAFEAYKVKVFDENKNKTTQAVLSEERSVLVKAMLDYDVTPAGQKELESSYRDTDDDRKKKVFLNRLKKGKGTRKKQLEAYQQTHLDAVLSAEDKDEYTSADNDGFIHDEKFRNVKKMPALFVIDHQNNVTTDSINPNAEWLFNEPSRATIKRDGTSITVDEDGKIFARRSVKKGKKAPANYIEAEVDPVTGHSFGLEPMEQSGFAKMFTEASAGQYLQPGTYELCGPKINGNPESLTSHQLLRHGDDEAVEIPDMRTLSPAQAFDEMKKVFTEYKKRGIEGVVWWGSDGKRVKLRVKDFFGDPNRR